MQITNAMMRGSNFDPEESNFSKMDTLKTWVASKHHTNTLLMKDIQKHISFAVRENPCSLIITNFASSVDGKYYGKMLPTLSAIELPFLQFVHELSKTKAPVTLEIGAGIMLVSWKIPLTYENQIGTHYANDLNSKLINLGKNTINKYLNGTNLEGTIKILQGDCFSVFEDLKGKCDAIYVANLEHFFNPKQHTQFLQLIEQLLAPGGKAFLCANSFTFGTDETHPLRRLYAFQKSKADLYYVYPI